MPGKLCDGATMYNAGAGRLSASKAYCEAIAYRAAGSAIAHPKLFNPHPPSSEDGLAWDRGWDKAQASAGGELSKADRGCCAATGVIPV